MAVPKLYYFNVEGRGEAIRLAFALSKQDFEDIRINPEEWVKEFKEKSPTGKAPFLETEDGKIICESVALLMYAGKKGDLLPVSEEGLAKCMEIIMTMEILGNKLAELYHSADEQKEAKLKEFNATDLPNTFQIVEKMAAATQSPNGYLVDDKLTILDLYIYQIVRAITVTKTMNILDIDITKLPNLKKAYDATLSKITAINYY